MPSNEGSPGTARHYRDLEMRFGAVRRSGFEAPDGEADTWFRCRVRRLRYLLLAIPRPFTHNSPHAIWGDSCSRLD